jgi:iron complex outermembrane receptor protein
VPHWLWSGGVTYAPTTPLTLSLTGRGQSSYELSSANAEGKWGALTVFDASAAFTVHPKIELTVAVRNLGNAYFEYVWWDGAQTLHSPASGRNVSISARLRF